MALTLAMLGARPGVESRQRVDELVDTALATGGSPANDPMEQGPMYGRSFQDPDGHHWEVVFMDPAAIGN
jgi:predicted lactoylglutathione lyase